MYLAHFGLTQLPFSITPNPAFFYEGSQRGAILEALLYAVTHGEGIIKVTGEVGSGKTMLCRMLESLLPESVEVLYLVNPSLGREEVLYTIAGELGLAVDGLRADEVMRLMQNELIAKHVAGKQVVLLVEEAQAMPLETLEEIRLFSNLETAHHKLLQIVLFGQPELDESLRLPRMRQLKERITHSFKVPPLPRVLIPEFLMFRLRAAGYHGGEVFSRGAVSLIAGVSEGIVRRISILADKALLAAFVDNSHVVQPRHVKAAIRDSEFSATATRRKRRQWAIGAALSLFIGLVALVAWRGLPSSASHSAAEAPVALTAASPAGVDAAAHGTGATGARPSQEAAATPSASPAGTAGRQDSPLAARIAASQRWLASTDAKYYTVQLMLIPADDPARLARFLNTAGSRLKPDQLRLYPTRTAAGPHFGVVYGSYATRPEAVAERARLTGDKTFRLQLRTVEGLRAEIARTDSAALW